MPNLKRLTLIINRVSANLKLRVFGLSCGKLIIINFLLLDSISDNDVEYKKTFIKVDFSNNPLYNILKPSGRYSEGGVIQCPKNLIY